MIPKVIHYCWFGGNPKPKLAEKCIKSWKKYLKDYEIKEWNESNYDISSAPLYVRQAYEAKKWAFVSDYVRFEVIYKYGGVYFDTDVELIKDLHPILEKGPFMACETDGKMNTAIDSSAGATSIDVAPGLGISANPGLGIYKELLDSYKDDVFIENNGSLNLKTVVQRTTDILFLHGLKDQKGIQKVARITIYPTEYFCPINYFTGEFKKTRSTVSIHHYSASWLDEKAKQKHKEDLIEYAKQRKRSKKQKRKIKFVSFIINCIGIENYKKLRKKV